MIINTERVANYEAKKLGLISPKKTNDASLLKGRGSDESYVMQRQEIKCQ